MDITHHEDSANSGAVRLDTPLAQEIGFTSDKFEGYCWIMPSNTFVVSVITSKHPGNGNLRALFNNVLAKGYRIEVPTPLARMRDICMRLGFHEEAAEDPDFGIVEILVKCPQE